MWPFDRERKTLASIVGPAAAPWLDRSEITAWTPDANYKAQAYFVVRDMSEEDFRAWAATVDLTVSEAPSVPSGVFVLPAGVEMDRWRAPAPGLGAGLDGRGTTGGATIWSRWDAGVTYTVIRPIY